VEVQGGEQADRVVGNMPFEDVKVVAVVEKVRRGRRCCPLPGRGGRRAVQDSTGALVECDARRVPADVAEGLVVSRLKERLAPDAAIAAAREELARRLRAPQPGTIDRERERLGTRLGKLADRYGWGDLSEADYRKQVAEVRAQIALLPGSDNRLVLFDKYRAEVRAFGEMVDAASGDKLQELVPWLVERVETHDRSVVRIVPTPAVRPFFEWADDEALRGVWRPRTDSNRRRRP
jgi:hypothetical protein